MKIPYITSASVFLALRFKDFFSRRNCDSRIKRQLVSVISHSNVYFWWQFNIETLSTNLDVKNVYIIVCVSHTGAFSCKKNL
jgi:hypothetical protein